MSDELITQNDYAQTEEFGFFIEECRQIFVQKLKESKYALVEAKWLLGKRITEEELKWARAPKGEKIIEVISVALGISPVHLWKIIQFYKVYPVEKYKTFDEVWMDLPSVLGDNVSWFNITTKVLPKTRQEELKDTEQKLSQEDCPHTRLKCMDCKKQFTIDELLQLDNPDK